MKLFLVIFVLYFSALFAKPVVQTIRDPSCELFVVMDGSRFSTRVIRADVPENVRVLADINPILNRHGYRLRMISNEGLERMGPVQGTHKYFLLRVSQEPEVTMKGYYGGFERTPNGVIKRISISRVEEKSTFRMKEKRWDSTLFADVCHQDAAYSGSNGYLPACRAENNFEAMAKLLPICVKVESH